MDSNAGCIIIAEVSEIVSKQPYKILAYAASESCDGEELEISYLGKPDFKTGQRILVILESMEKSARIARAGYVSSIIPDGFDIVESSDAVLVAAWEGRMRKNLAPTLSQFRYYFGVKDLSRMLYYEQYEGYFLPVCVLEGKQPAIIRRMVNNEGLITLERYLGILALIEENKIKKEEEKKEHIEAPLLQSLAGAFRVYESGNARYRRSALGNGSKKRNGSHLLCSPNVVVIHGKKELENLILREIQDDPENKGISIIRMEAQR
jgi:hypothetical protein